MALIVGLDLGTKTITGAVFSGTPGKFRLKDFFVKDIPTIADAAAAGSGTGELSTPLSIPELLLGLFQDRGLQNAEVVAGVDAKDCIIREIVVPFTKDEHIRKTISAEAEEHFQTFDIADVQLEYFKVGEMGDKSRVVIAAVRNEAIRDRLETLRQGGIDPIALDLDAAALFNAFATTPTFDPQRTVLLIDMGATTTKVLLVEKGQLKKIRSIRLSSMSSSRLLAQPVGAAVGARAEGGGALPFPDTYSIEARFAEIENALRRLDPLGGEDLGKLGEDEPIAILTDEEYDLIRHGKGDATGGAIHGAPSPGREDGGAAAAGSTGAGGSAQAGNGALPPPGPMLDDPQLHFGDYLLRLGIEIQRTFATSILGGGVDMICLTGGMSHREEARRFFTDEFDVETIHLDFGDSFPIDLEKEKQEEVSRVGAVAVGLAMKELGGDRVGFDFRKNQFRFERKFERIKYPILCLAVVTFLVFLQGFFILSKEWVGMSRRIDWIQASERRIYKGFFDKDNSSEMLKPQADSAQKDMERQLGKGGGNIPYFIPFLDAMEEVSQAIQECGATVRMTSVDFKFKTTQMAGKPLRAEGNSTINLTTSESGVGTKLEQIFASKKIFSVSISERKDPNGTIKLDVTLTPRAEYLSSKK
jgi:Tfp pilus assembly PilM family ATPase